MTDKIEEAAKQIQEMRRILANGGTPLRECVAHFPGETFDDKMRSYVCAEKIVHDAFMAEQQTKNLVVTMAEQKLVISRSEARRVICQGGVKINNILTTDIDATVKTGDTITLGDKKEITVECHHNKNKSTSKSKNSQITPTNTASN